MSKAFQIKDFPGYFINKNGEIFSNKYHPIKNKNNKMQKLKLHLDTNGYLSVMLYKEKIPTRVRVHRVVAETFLANPENKPEVNHIDGNKQNNNVSNLDWCSHSENNIHAYRVLGKKGHWEGKIGANNPHSKIVLQIKEGEIIAEFYGTSEASRQTNIEQNSICRCCNGKRKTAGGFRWKYK